MLNLWVMGLVIIVLLRDSFARGGSSGHGLVPPSQGAFLDPGTWSNWLLGLLPYLAIAFMVHVVMVAAARELDRLGRAKAIVIADRVALCGRFLTLLVHAGNVFLLGWLTGARRLVGDVLLIDEVLCILPPVGVIVLGWYSGYQIERRIREAVLMRTLDTGEPVYPIPSARQHVMQNVRNQLALSLVPIMLISLYSEGTDRGLRWLASRRWGEPGLLHDLGAYIAQPQRAPVIQLALQLVGVALVFTLTPLVLRRIWDTVRLSPGPLRDRLNRMCRDHGVKMRDILVWRTYGSMLNGAVVGVAAPVRYVLLTDALLDRMPRRQVEAVMAHEIAHARCAHMPWLVAVLIAAVGCSAAMGSWLLGGVASAVDNWDYGREGLVSEQMGQDGSGYFASKPPARDDERLTGMAILAAGEGAVVVGSLVFGFLAFGLVSRRFEWQADSFAARALTLMPEEPEPDTVDVPFAPKRVHVTRSTRGNVQRIEPAAVDAMTGALGTVARLNFIPRHRRSFRHGSIAERQQKLRQLVGKPVNRLPIDRTVRGIKWLALLGIVLLVVLAAMGF